MKLCAEKYVTAQEAVGTVKNGDRVGWSGACGDPAALLEALGARMHELKDVETFNMLNMGYAPHTDPASAGHIHHNSLYVGGADRKAVENGNADFIPRYFSKIPDLFHEKTLPLDVCLLQVSPPDRHGWVSFGISVEYAIAMHRNATVRIAQVNCNVPRCHGDCFAHISEFDWLVEADTPLREIPRAELTDIEKAIGRHCANLVPDGATLQLGIGSLPDAVLLSLTDKKDLGIHSEMFSDGVMDLVEAGVITNRKKTLHPGKMVATFLMGSRKFYDFVDDNPSVCMAPVNYTNDPYVIAKNDNLISINSCVQLDLMGQVCAESIGLRQISGVGGQVDFIRGAHLSKGGKTIIAIASTTPDGQISKIVPFLDVGAAVTTNRHDVGYIVTEYGAVDLQGKSLRERAKSLIEIAHPNFRPVLAEEYERRFKRVWAGMPAVSYAAPALATAAAV